MKIEEYIKTFGFHAIESCEASGLFPSVKMAQAILESSSGNSTLAAKHNNHFGIKRGIGWKGEVVSMKTGEVLNGRSVTITDAFRKYSDAFSSFVDHTRFLQNNSRYAKAGVFKAATPEAQILAIKNAGYATDPEYVNKIISLITKWNLKSLDLKKKA